MRKIKVLHCVGRMDRGGLETFIMNIYRNIDKELIQFDFLVSSNQPGDFNEEIRALGGEIYFIPNPRRAQDFLKYYKKLKALIFSNNYEVVHSHVMFFSGMNALIAKNSKVPVIISHSHNISDSKEDTFIRNSYRKFFRKLILKNSTHLLGCSKEAITYLFNDLNDPRILDVKNGIYVEEFIKPLSISNRKKYLDEIGIPNNSKLVGHIGRFHHQKNHLFLIDIFKEISKMDDDYYLILVGKGDLEDKIKNKVVNLGLESKIKFLGVRDDIEKIIKLFDVFCFPSQYEGLGIVLIEAQAAGIPCFVSDTIPYEAEMDPDIYKRLPLNKEPEYWANTIINTDMRKSLNSYKKVIIKGYSIEETVKTLESLYLRENI